MTYGFLKHTILVTMTSLLALSSCKKDDEKKDTTTPPIINPEEQITTVMLNGYNHDDPTNPVYQFAVKWEDLDGAGGNAPTIDTLLLDTGIEYHVHVLLLDKTKIPYDTISNEVEEESNVHQFFYTPDANLATKMSIQRLDNDGNTPPLPLGLAFHLNTKSTATYQLPFTGGLNMVLSHYDGIPKTTAPSPESDIDVTFPVRLK